MIPNIMDPNIAWAKETLFHCLKTKQNKTEAGTERKMKKISPKEAHYACKQVFRSEEMTKKEKKCFLFFLILLEFVNEDFWYLNISLILTLTSTTELGTVF